MSTPGELLEALSREARSRFGGGAQGATRVYRGRSVEELVPQIQRDLGSDAIILRRREGLTGGVLGFFQRQYVEIEAMPGAPRVDLYDAAEPALPPGPPAAPQPPAPPAIEQQPPELAATAPLPPAPEPAPPAPEPEPAPPARPLGSAYVTAHLAALARGEVTSPGAPAPSPIRAARESRPRARPAERPRAPAEPALDFHELFPPREPPPVPRREPPSRQPPAPAPAPFAGAELPAFEQFAAPPERAPRAERRAAGPGSHSRARAGVEKGLRRFGISEELAGELIEGAAAHALPLAPRAGLAQAVRMTLAQRIPVAPALGTKGAAVVLVGAGGAGKTSCCSALLGAYRRNSSLPASFATLIWGDELPDLQLMLSPQIMKPMAASSQRALRAIERAKAHGLAVLDTPGLSPAEKAGVRALALVLGELAPERIVVALPATLGATAAAQLLSALRPLGANAMAVTHADETDQIGVAIEAACSFGLAPEYMLERARAGGWRMSRLDPASLAARVLP